MMLQKMRNDQKGFTLIELMIVIAIIGILAAIAIPNFLSYRTRGMNQSAEHTAKNFVNLAMAYIADTGQSIINSTNVPGFDAPAEIVATGPPSLTYTASSDSWTGAGNFSHSSGNKTYTIGNSTGDGYPVIVEAAS